MKEQLIKIYKCSYCPRPKLYQRKSACERHEIICSYNPENNRACFWCKFLEMVRAINLDDGYNGEIENGVDVLKCTKIDKYVYPPKVEHKKNWFNGLDLENEPMPKTCKDFNGEYIQDEPNYI